MDKGKLVEEWPGRTFQLWFYTPSHSCLLFRSTKSTLHPTRIDLLFWSVGALECKTNMTSLKIVEVPIAAMTGLATYPTVPPHSYYKCYLLESAEASGYVIASSVQTCEDDKEWHEPSSLNI